MYKLNLHDLACTSLWYISTQYSKHSVKSENLYIYMCVCVQFRIVFILRTMLKITRYIAL